MPRYEPLNPQDHGQLRLRPRSGSDPHFVQIVASEFAAAAVSSPILLTKDPEKGSFYAGAMFGFKSAEPALKSAAERGGFEPLSLQREGFFTTGESIVIDRDCPRFSDSDGDPLFDESQQPSPRLRQMQRVLGQLHAGLEATQAFIQAVVELRAVEPIDISLGFDDGEKLSLQGLYTVSLDSLNALDDAQALRLFRAGYLHLAYIIAGSLNQIGVLAQLRNQRLSDALR
jgi:hypothetical protein